jgi:NADPH2:quinone reductase
VHAAGVNFPDALLVSGKYQMKPELPFIPGSEVAGKVLAVGENVKGIAVDDHIVSTLQLGGYADMVVAESSECIVIPKTVPFDKAAAMMLTYGTSYHALKDRAHLQPGQNILVLGAAGGVGIAACQLAKNMGANMIIAAASTQEKCDFAVKYGYANRTINYGSMDNKQFRKAIEKALDSAPLNVVYDPIGSWYTEAAFRSLAWEGHHLMVGFAADGTKIPALPANLPLLKGASLTGVFWGRSVAENPEKAAGNARELCDMLVKGKINPMVHKTFPLEDAIGALKEVYGRKVMGKVVLTTSNTKVASKL